ncbi:MAG: hypothetical protein U0556_17780 [Dehalococcoidia bacterium]
MTATFANVSFHTAHDDAVFDLMADEDAFVSSAMLGWVTVYDRLADLGDLSRLADVTVRISGALDCPALAMLVVEGDVFFYLLFERGELVDEYASEPDFYGEVTLDERAELGGRPERLLPYAVPGVRLDQLRTLLKDSTLSAGDRCRALADRLGIQNATLGYGDLLAKADGEAIAVVGWDLFQFSGDALADDEPEPPSQNGHYV